jgi:hypothetical protein
MRYEKEVVTGKGQPIFSFHSLYLRRPCEDEIDKRVTYLFCKALLQNK